jgi:cyclopropane-fatty-acyl-phospholipid synthase
MRRILRGLGDPPMRMILWGEEEVSPATESPLATVRIPDRGTLVRLITHPELEFGDGYAEGRIGVDGDLIPLIETVFRASHNVGLVPVWMQAIPRGARRRRSRRRSKENVHHHYDIGNDFYRLWLDEEMVYTCAYFPTPEASLEEAQHAKMDQVCRKVRLRPGEQVVEAGCGWGSLALHMARHYGVKVRAFNISAEQIAYARDRARREGLEGQVEFVEDDYRNISGRYDAFVSVGMLEHVGPRHYKELGRVIDRSIGASGRGLIHSIGRNRPRPPSEWIERRVFPGAYMPSLKQMAAIFEPYDFSVLDVENLRLHYARTLQHWLERFEKSEDQVARMFDERFVRMWRLYLSSSVGSVLSGSLQLFQVVFARGTSNDLPLTREHLYREA